MSVLRSINTDIIYDNVEIHNVEGLEDVFSTSVDLDIIPISYELINANEIKLNYIKDSFQQFKMMSDKCANIGNRGNVVTKLQSPFMENLIELKKKYKVNSENFEVIKYFLENVLESK